MYIIINASDFRNHFKITLFGNQMGQGGEAGRDGCL